MDDVCVTIKLTLSGSEIVEYYGASLREAEKQKIVSKNQWVVTVFRDPDSYELFRDKREVGRNVYDVERNTAFIHIFKEKKAYFCCDDLDALGAVYLNENPTWKDQYNATIVAPIRYAKDGGEYRCFGLLAVDSMNSRRLKLFENDEAAHIIGHAADLLATYFLALSLSKPENLAVPNAA